MSAQMIDFKLPDRQTFLNEYWQKKPLLFKQALTDFLPPLSANELAGLALEEDIESRLVIEDPSKTNHWTLTTGPLSEKQLTTLPKTHWSLLIQGVDKYIPEVNQLLNEFDFIPPWRLDDIMIGLSSQHGSVGPHYDNYDVFLFQAAGQKEWSLTTKNCHEDNIIPDLDLRIMADFDIEQTYVLSPGDLLYLPAHVGHHGVSMSEECMTYSFGYRSYQAQELWDSFGDYLSEKSKASQLYQDPIWSQLTNTAEIPKAAFQQAKQLMLDLLDDETSLQHWFSGFATQLDEPSRQLQPVPLTDDEAGNLESLVQAIKDSEGFIRDLNCRMAYHRIDDSLSLFINGEQWDTCNATHELIEMVAGNRFIHRRDLLALLTISENQSFIYKLWKNQHIDLL